MFRILIFFLSLSSFVHSLEIRRVIMATDNNPLYIEFWPVIAPLYEKMGFKPTLAFIAEEDAPIDTSVGDVYRFPPLPNIPVSLQAQAIRLLLPALFPDEGCLISDIDMILISRDYFVDEAAFCPNDALLVYRDQSEGYVENRYPMCYVAAKGSVFSSIFQIENPMQIPEILNRWSQLDLGWNTDEIVLYQSANEWEKRGGHVIRLGHGVFGRLDRGNWNIDFDSIQISNYVDCHCPRPYSSYRDSIDRIVEAIYKNLGPSI